MPPSLFAGWSDGWCTCFRWFTLSLFIHMPLLVSTGCNDGGKFKQCWLRQVGAGPGATSWAHKRCRSLQPAKCVE